MPQRSALNVALRELLACPRGGQWALSVALRDRFEAAAHPEEWNTLFGPSSIFAAWTGSPIMQGLYESNRALLLPFLNARPGWRAIEIGGGDGRLWQTLRPHTKGELVLVDPQPQVHEQVARCLPENVTLRSFVGLAQDLPDCDGSGWGEADLFLSSLTLHHVAGRDQREREAHGLTGPGKLEILERARAATRKRQGIGLLNEADVFCELALPAGDLQLRDHLMDSYLRRCAQGMLDAIDADPEHPMAPQWEIVAHRWCLDQLAMAEVPVDKRDVYELDVERWTALIGRAGWAVTGRHFTDPYRLFCQYQLA